MAIDPLDLPFAWPARLRREMTAGLFLLPGLALAGALAAAAFGLRAQLDLGGVSPLILALVLGIAVGNLARMPELARPGLALAMRPALRAGIVLLGLQLTLGQVAEIGMAAVSVLVAVVAATLGFGLWLGRRLRIEAGLAQLITIGSAICGASAIVAANTVVRRPDEDVAYAVACVTVFGTLSMLLMPLVAPLLGLDAFAHGLWTGATIHEVAQVAGAAFVLGPEAGQVGTIAKLARVVMLAPVVLALGVWVRQAGRRQLRDTGPAAVAFPGFVLGFGAMVALSSTGLVPAELRLVAAEVTQALLATALAAMGLQTRFGMLWARGAGPAILAAALWVFISLFGLVLVVLVA